MINDVIDATLDTTTVHSKIRDASLSEILRNGNTIKDTVSSTKFMIVDNDIKNDVLYQSLPLIIERTVKRSTRESNVSKSNISINTEPKIGLNASARNTIKLDSNGIASCILYLRILNTSKAVLIFMRC